MNTIRIFLNYLISSNNLVILTSFIAILATYLLLSSDISIFSEESSMFLKNEVDENSSENLKKDEEVNKSKKKEEKSQRIEMKGFQQNEIYEDDEILRGEEGMIANQKQNIEEKGLEMLCLYLKNSVKEMSKDKSGESIFFNNKNKNVMNALSGNAIYDLNIRDLVDNILTENDNEYTKTNEGNNNSLKDYILQNIESDSNLKIMIMSNNDSTKNSFIETFFGIKKEIIQIIVPRVAIC